MDSTNDKQSSRVSHIAVLAVLAVVLSIGGLRDVPNVKSAYKCQEAGDEDGEDLMVVCPNCK